MVTRRFLDGLVEARRVEPDVWTVYCRNVELGTIDYHRGDPGWIADRRWEIRGSRIERGYGGRLESGWPTLEAAVRVLCRFRSAEIMSMCPE